MQWNKFVALLLLLLGGNAHAQSPDIFYFDAMKTIQPCLSGKVNLDDALACVGRYSDRCAVEADRSPPIPQIADQAKCLLNEAEAWEKIRDKAVHSWKQNNGTNLSVKIAEIAKESQRFAALKCGVFHDTAQFGQTGMALEAECLRDEAARIAVFIGYGLD